MEVNNGLRQGLESGLPIANVMENWEYLQVCMREYVCMCKELGVVKGVPHGRFLAITLYQCDKKHPQDGNVE